MANLGGVACYTAQLTLPSLEIDVSSENVVQADFSINNRLSIFAIFVLAFAIFANAANIATLTSTTTTTTSNGFTAFSGIGRRLADGSVVEHASSVTAGAATATTGTATTTGFQAFTGTGHRLGGDRTQAQSRLLELGVQRAAQQVIQRSDTVATTLAQNVFQETAGVCTRTSSCAAATLQHFPSIGASGTTSQAAQQVVQNIAITETNSAIGRVLSNAGPIIATGVATYEVVGNLREGDYTGAVTSATGAFASYHAAAAAGAACATWAAPSAALNPLLPALAGFACAVTSGFATRTAVNAAASVVTTSVLASSNSGASLPELPAPAPVELPAPAPVELPALVVEPVNDAVDDIWEPTADQLSNASYLEALRRAEIFLEENNRGELNRTSRRLINFIINDNIREGNALQPSQHSHMLLRHFVNSGQIVNPGNMSNSEWMNLMGNGRSLFRSVLNSTREDQFLRARSIAQTLIETGENTVSLMDGHGRIIYLILWHLRNQGMNIDDYRFQIFDLDHDVNAWHARFLPTSVTVLPQDIFADRAELQGVVYFNFCGIGDFVGQTRGAIRRLVRQGRVVYLSFSRRGINPQGETSLARFYRRIIRRTIRPVDGMSAEFVSSHGTFPTYKFFQSE